MKIFSMFLIYTLIFFGFAGENAISETNKIKIQFNYNKVFYDSIVGFRIYKGPSPGAVDTMIADVKRAQAVIISERPVLLNEKFDRDPGNKYNVTLGAWKWEKSECEYNSSMKIDSTEFMVVFDLPAGASNDMVYQFWPMKSMSDQPNVYNYIKDESLSAYYELRFAGDNGIRYSNWRKVYDKKYGGVDGAFALPRYSQCNIKASSLTCCPGYSVFLTWRPGHYEASIFDKDFETIYGNAIGTDEKPLNINKLELIIKNQTGWIDDIVIGGQMMLQVETDIVIDTEKTFIAVSAYRESGGKIVEGLKTEAVEYVSRGGGASTRPEMPTKIIILK